MEPFAVGNEAREAIGELLFVYYLLLRKIQPVSLTCLFLEAKRATKKVVKGDWVAVCMVLITNACCFQCSLLVTQVAEYIPYKNSSDLCVDFWCICCLPCQPCTSTLCWELR